MAQVGILGAGSWGIALAMLLKKNGNEVAVWSALEKEIDNLKLTNKCDKLPDIDLPEGIVYTKSFEEACSEKDIILFAVPSPFVRSTAKMLKKYIKDNQIIVNVSKGIESDTLMTLTDVIKDELKNDTVKLVALSGPTHAEEVALYMPSTIVSGCEDIKAAEYVQRVFSGNCMRVYTNTDVLGMEICGALKNIIALASGISSGLGYGDNAKAALITRGIAEISRLGVAMKCNMETFYGLTGVGDLVVTCTSEHSRNYKAGRMIGEGYSVEEAKEKVGMVVEGINAIPAAVKLAEKYDVDMPIISAVNDVINKGVPASKVADRLMCRENKSELEKK